MKKTRKAILFFCLSMILGSRLFADTIRLKDGSEVKGIVVEALADRIVLSTEYGETEVPKSEISKIKYDLPEQNLVAIADKYMAAKDYSKAFYYYDKAKKANPKCKEAIEGYNYLSGYMYRKATDKKAKAVKWRSTVENFKETGQTEVSRKENTVENTIGISIIQQEDGRVVIKNVVKGKPGYKAGIKKGDILSSIWGRLCKYMDVAEVKESLSDPDQMEIKISIDRTLKVKKKSIASEQLEYLFDGLSLMNIAKEDNAYNSGLRNKDIILAIGKDSIRYMPLKEVLKRLKRSNQSIVIRRDVTIWRKKDV